MSQQRIRQWFDYWDGQVYVSFSGGKDSTVLKHLVENTPGVYGVPSLFVNTGLEYPEIQKFAMSQPNVTTVRPEMRFDEVIKKYGYPVISKEVSFKVDNARKDGVCLDDFTKGTTREMRNGGRYSLVKYQYLLRSDFGISNKCCDVMKKKPAKAYEKETGRKAIIGTLAEESAVRQQAWMKNGCNAFNSQRPVSQPLSFWTEQDILHYIKKYNLPYCSVYGDIVVNTDADIPDGQMNIFDYLGDYKEGDRLKTTGCNRTGCVFCVFGITQDGNPNRFQRLKETHPRQYDYCINGGEFVEGKWQPNKEGLGLGYVLDYIGVKY